MKVANNNIGDAHSLPKGYKQTEVGVIPEDWEVKTLGDVGKINMGQSPLSINYNNNGIGLPLIQGNADVKNRETIIRNFTSQITKKAKVGEIIMSVRAPVGEISKTQFDCCIGRGVCAISYENDYLYHYLIYFENSWGQFSTGSTFDSVNSNQIKSIKIPLPPTLKEQKAIATALSDVDELIANLDKLIEKKKAIKQGAMQELLTPPHTCAEQSRSKGGKRLPGFDGEWDLLTVEEVAYCLDYLRVPLNSEQRSKMNGDIPYCGANGIVDYVDNYVIDDDIILIAEDGGYFDEYKTRPIAYRIVGKCWVNNHAHILKSKKGFSQDFLFYSLVHKNILDYINGGTRAKLNKGEMNKIEIWLPVSYEEQYEISHILNDLDKEIEQLEAKKAKYNQIKQGMMQELLTGKIRLV